MEHDKSGSGISSTIAVTVTWALNATEDGSPTNPPGISTPELDKSEYEISTISLIAMGVLVVAAFFFLNFPFICMCFHCNRQDHAHDAQDQAQDTSDPPPAATMGKKERESMRYAQIESWLISRKIQPHDEICKKALMYLDSCTDIPKELKHRTWSADTVCTNMECGSISVVEEKECPVCMDTLEAGDIVSWSPNTSCEHVFHHCCIKEWLIKRKCCPCCRQTFLPIDQLEGLTKSKQIEELLLGQQQRAANRFFCISHGVVALSKPELCFTKKCELELMFNKVNSVPSRAELAAIRGCRIEGIVGSCEQDALSSDSIDEELAEPHRSESTDDLQVVAETASISTDECIPVNLYVLEDEATPTAVSSDSIDEELAEPHRSESTDDLQVVAETASIPTDECIPVNLYVLEDEPTPNAISSDSIDEELGAEPHRSESTDDPQVVAETASIPTDEQQSP
jgi:hypothetical protein